VAGGIEFAPREEPFERRPLSNVRRTIAERMSLAWSTIPHVTLTARADVTEVEEVRRRYKAKGHPDAGKVTITAILLKVAASALKVFPDVNSSLQVQEGELLVKRQVSLGVAVDTERGLLVPVVRDADKKNILELSSELSELSERARSGKLKPDDMKGAGFTLTNLGGMGIAEFTPIINPPEVAVLGVGRAELVPQFTDDGELVGRRMLPLSLSIDHRVLDGADGARFLQWIVRALEDPLVLALEG
jgi:pyruvate dehydrogenase E2 component (dihydrolipoamide acetyltransferase)